jgi:hypothetical protein
MRLPEAGRSRSNGPTATVDEPFDPRGGGGADVFCRPRSRLGLMPMFNTVLYMRARGKEKPPLAVCRT